MASLTAQAPDGKTLTIQVPEGTDPSMYPKMVDEAVGHYSQQSKPQSLGGSVMDMMKSTVPNIIHRELLPTTGMMMGASQGSAMGAAAGSSLGPLGTIVGGFGGALVGAGIGAMSGRAATEAVDAATNLIVPGTNQEKTPSQVVNDSASAFKSGVEAEFLGRTLSGALWLGGRYGPGLAKEYTPTFYELGGKLAEGFKQLASIKLPLTPAEVTQSKQWAAAESLLGKMPISSGLLQKMQNIRTAALNDYRNSLFDIISSKMSDEELGNMTKDSLKNFIEGVTNTRQGALSAMRGSIIPAVENQAPIQVGEDLIKIVKDAKEAMRLKKNDFYLQAGKAVPEQLSVFPADNLRATARNILATQGSAPSTIPSGMRAHLNEILNAPQGLSWDKMHWLQSDYGDTANAIYRSNNGFMTPEGKMWLKLQEGARADMQKAANNYGGELLEKYNFAQAFNKKFRGTFDNKVITRFLNTKPDKVFDLFVKSGSIEDLRTLKSVVGENGFGQLRKMLVEDVIGSAEDKLPSGVEMASKLERYKYKLREILSPKQIEQIKNFSKTGELPQFIQNEIEKKVVQLSSKIPTLLVNEVMKGDPTITRAIKSVVGDEGWQPYRRKLLEKIINDPATDLPTGEKIVKTINNMDQDFRKLFFSDGEIADIRKIGEAKTLMDTGERLYGNKSGTARNIISWETGKLLLTNPVKGTMLLVTGPLLGKFYLSDTGRKLLINGLSSNASNALVNFNRLASFVATSQKELNKEPNLDAKTP